MKRFTQTLTGVLGLLMLFALASGCTTTRRYITHTVAGTGDVSVASLPPEYRVGQAPDATADEDGADAAAETAEGTEAGADDATDMPPTTPATDGAAEPAALTEPPAGGTATNWMYIAYAEVKETNLFIMKQFKTTSRVLRCLIQDDNSVVCDDQETANQLFNPQDQ